MGILSGVKAAFRKSEAAVVIEKLLDVQSAAGLFDERPAAVANKLVEVVWVRNPAVFSAGAGLPNKYALAAAALSSGVNAMLHDASVRAAFVICLGAVLREVHLREGGLVLSALDLKLVEAAESVYSHAVAQPRIDWPAGATAIAPDLGDTPGVRPQHSGAAPDLWSVRPGEK